MKKVLFLAITTTIIISACANSSAVDEQTRIANDIGSDSETSESATDESYSNPEDNSDISVDSLSSDTGYKQAYKEIIEYEQERISSVSPETSPNEYEECIDCYWLYDIDKDNIPELLIRYGHCEAAFHGKLYTYANGEAQLVSDEVMMSHTSFYAIPGENGILSYWAHMGCMSCFKLILKNGKIESEELYSEDISQAEEGVVYKASYEIVDGAYYLEELYYDSTYPIEMYDVMAEYSSDNRKLDSVSYTFPDNNPDFYKDIMQNDGVVNAVALDQFMNTLGEVQFSKILEDSKIYDYARGPHEVNGIIYADLNADGIYECIFYISEKSDYTNADKAYRVIMSLQDDTVYAYLAFSPYENTITENGDFITEPGEFYNERYVKRVLYDKEKCFTYSVPKE